GIRDGHVTGVQTCALPIYLNEVEVAAVVPILPPRPRNQDCQGTIVPMQGTCAASHWSETGFTVSGAEVVSMMSTLFWVISCWARSEERRVGKEGSAGWERN